MLKKITRTIISNIEWVFSFEKKNVLPEKNPQRIKKYSTNSLNSSKNNILNKFVVND